MVSYVKAKHKTQELLLSTRQRNAVLVGWADFRQYINLYLPKLTIDLADPYNSMLAIESCNHYRSSFSVSVAHIVDPFQSSLILVKTVCMYAK